MTRIDLFNFQDHYPNSPGYRRRRPTSRAGAAHIKPKAPTLRDRVLAILRKAEEAQPSVAKGYTTDECARILNVSILSCRPRLSELVRLGLVFDSGLTRRNISGVSAVVWRVRS